MSVSMFKTRGYQPLVLAAAVHSEGATMLWRPTPPVIEWIQDDLFIRLTVLNRASRVLARLTILGNFIWQAGRPDLFLDADVFGMRVASDVPPSVRGRLPSGDGRRGGRLDMWFWVVTPIDISISPDTVRLQISAQIPVPVVFTVTVDGTEGRRVEVSVNGVVGGNSAIGTISLTDEAQGGPVWLERSGLSERVWRPTRPSPEGSVERCRFGVLQKERDIADAQAAILQQGPRELPSYLIENLAE
jgi:hypothetical protein